MIAAPVRPKAPHTPAAPLLPLPQPQAAAAASPVARKSADGSGAVLVLHARALRHEGFGAAAAAVLQGLGLMTGSERVSLGLNAHGGLKMAATCTGADLSQRLNFTEALTAAMQETADQRAAIIFPVPQQSAPTLCFAHAELHRANGGLAALSVPILGPDRVIGALLLERQGGFTEQHLRLAKDAALFVGPVLELKHRVESPLAGRLIQAVNPGGAGLVAGSRVPTWRWVAGGATLALVVAALWPVTLRVVAPARVEGIDQRVLAAPVDGYIASVAVRPGESVRAGQVLGTLDDRELLLQSERLGAEVGQAEKKYREALAGDDAGEMVLTRAGLEQVRAQQALASSELERTRLRAPFDGVLVAGDLSGLVGSPVTRGQPLMTVSPTRGYKVVAEVADHDITVLETGQTAQVLLAGLGHQPASFTVQRIAPVAVTLDQRNVFEIEGQLSAEDAARLSPGLRGVVRIDIDQRLQVQVWWLRAGHWLRRALWQLMG